MGAEARGGLDDFPFAFREGGDGRLFITWRGRQVMILKDKPAHSFLERVSGLDAAGQQLAMARVTAGCGRRARGGNRHGRRRWRVSGERPHRGGAGRAEAPSRGKRLGTTGAECHPTRPAFRVGVDVWGAASARVALDRPCEE